MTREGVQEEKRMVNRPRPFRCDWCRSMVVRDGEHEVYLGTQIVHTIQSCRPVRPAVARIRYDLR